MPSPKTPVVDRDDVEYHVHSCIFFNFDAAAGYAVARAGSCGSEHIDVVIFSEEGAKAYGGDDAVERYREDPDASVFERIEIKVNLAGRIP